MLHNYLLAIFHWRDHAGALDGSHPHSGLRTVLWACERWLEANPTSLGTDNGRRVEKIKSELEETLGRKTADQ